MRLLIPLMLLGLATPVWAGGPMSAEEEAVLVEKIRERDPTLADRLPRLKNREPERYYKLLQHMGRGMDRDLDDPEAQARQERLKSLRHEIRALAIEYQGATAGQQKSIRKDVEKLASQMFDLRQEQRRHQLAKLREKLEEAEAEVAEQDTNRAKVIEEHVDELFERLEQGP